MAYYTFVPETASTILTPTDAEHGINYLVTYTTSSLTDIESQEFGIAPIPGNIVSAQGFSSPDISNRLNYSSVKVGFIRYAGGRCTPIFCTLKPPNISSSAFTPIVVYTRYTTSTQSYSYSGYFASGWRASGIFDSETGYELYYYRQGNYLVSYTRPGAGIEMIELQPATQEEATIWWVNQCNDGKWVNVRDPYSQAPEGNTEKEGGTGDFDNTSDPIDFPPIPTISVSDTGFVNIYNPTLAQLQNLATFMWTNPLFDLTQWRALFANPMQAILSLAILPVAIPNGGTRTIKVGNISTDVSMTLAAQQFIEFDCGSLNINEYWGSYLDYSPFTRLSVFLPFVGYRDLNVDECMNKTLHVKYHIDIFTGACSAFIKCGNSVLYNFSGNCAFNVPLSGSDFSSVVNGILSAVGTGITALATGGESAAFGAVASMSADVMNAKPHIQKGGSMGGNAGFLGHRTPYLILIRPRQAVPQNQNEFLGYPSFITADLVNVTGYTEVINIFLQDGFTATENELNEIKRLLSEGVIL